MRRFIHIGALVCSVLAATAHACLWDRDTLAAEARGLPGITEVITGRFDRFPPLFYEMRLERVAGEIAGDPDNLDLYDDAGVACDRLGRSDEAIGWMERKLVVLERLEAEGADISEHRYRYLANLGTFYIHRWLKGMQDREDMGDVDRARDLIAAAIELNPDAHFGRERYQLLAIKSLFTKHKMTSFLGMLGPKQSEMSGFPSGLLEKKGYEDAVEGLTGLIQLGSAWESVRIYKALELALGDEGRGVMMMLAHLRTHEIRSRQFPEKPSSYCNSIQFVNNYTEQTLYRDYFSIARAEADQWVEARNSYLMERLEQGRHPDTDRKFWSQWVENTSPPPLPGSVNRLLINVVGVGLLVIIGFVIYRAYLRPSARVA